MTKLKIMVDLDGVVWDIMHVFVEIYNKLYNENQKYEDIDGWYYFPQERFEIVYPLTLPRIMDYKIVDHNISSYLSILSLNHDVDILTKEKNTVDVLEEKLISLDIIKGLHYGKIIRIDPKDNKLDYEADVYIDDYPGMAKKMHEFPKRVLLLYSQPWNKKYEASGNVIRVSSWEDVLRLIGRVEYAKRNNKDVVFC